MSKKKRKELELCGASACRRRPPGAEKATKADNREEDGTGKQVITDGNQAVAKS